MRLRAIYRKTRRLLGYTDTHWIRVHMNRVTREYVRAHAPQAKSVLEISGDGWKDFGFESYESLHYPDYDVCEGPAAESAYDLVIAEQVLEHLLWPRRAVANIYTMLRPGGVFLVTTPFLVRVHAFPIDCTRWTDIGLKYFLADAGFAIDKIEVGQWGNRSCAIRNFRPKWRKWHPVLHSLENQTLYPVSVWGFARK